MKRLLSAIVLGSMLFINGDFGKIMIAMAFFGVGQLALMSGSYALFADLVKQENRGKVTGFTNFTGYIAMGLGMLLGNYFYVSFIPQMPFYVTLGLAIPELLIVIFLIHEPKNKADSISKS